MGCKYEGEGEFSAEGTWPFTNYSVELPVFPLINGNVSTYSLAGFKSHTNTIIELVVRSPSPILFHRLDAILEIEISDTSGNIHFYRNGSLNGHYNRMVSQNETLWASDSEWNGRYVYQDGGIDNRAVPFSTEKEPVAVEEITYWHIAPLESRDLLAKVSILYVPTSYGDLKANIRLVSGWK